MDSVREQLKHCKIQHRYTQPRDMEIIDAIGPQEVLNAAVRTLNRLQALFATVPFGSQDYVELLIEFKTYGMYIDGAHHAVQLTSGANVLRPIVQRPPDLDPHQCPLCGCHAQAAAKPKRTRKKKEAAA